MSGLKAQFELRQMADLRTAPEQPQRADDEEYLLRLGSYFRERVEADERFAGIHVLQQLGGNERRVIRGKDRVGDTPRRSTNSGLPVPAA